jgi:hypothetical protein
LNAPERIRVPAALLKLSRLNLYRAYGANEKTPVGAAEKLARPVQAQQSAIQTGLSALKAWMT